MAGRKKVIIIGGGFAGLNLVRNLDRQLFDVMLIDKLNHHQFQPLFYQVATSQLEPSSISFPFRKIFQRSPHVQIRMAEVQRIEPKANRVVTPIGNFDYDYLVIATGCKTNFYGNDSIERNAMTLKSTYESITIRNRILQNFEGLYSALVEDREARMNLVIVGGGPTGVELAGAFAEIRKSVLPRDYPGIDFSGMHIYLIEGSANTLNNMSENAQTASQTYLKEMGVEIRTGVFVKNYDGLDVTLSNGQLIRSGNLIWAAGVTGNMPEGLAAETAATGSRIRVDRYNNVHPYANIYAVGDIAFMETPKYPKGHPQLANVAIHQAKNLAANLNAENMGKQKKVFEYRDLGSMATIGRHKAVVDLPFIRFKGYLAWFAWMFLHLMLILSVRNKLIIFINWAWNYLTRDTSLRLILTSVKKTTQKQHPDSAGI